MSDVNLNALKAGINRLRTKGGADPSSLYDLVNGFVTIDGSIQSRPGTVRKAVLPAGTKGLCAFNGGMVVFSSTPQTVPAGYTCEVLAHPTDSTQTIAEIHFAQPFMGYLYVAAEFANGDVIHYYLQSGGTWVANTMYKAGDTVLPTTPNGFRYQAVLKSNPAAWAPDVPRALGDVVQPTVYTGWKYTVVEVDGASPSSGASEPTWPESAGAQVSEDVDSTPAPAPPVTTNPIPGGGRYSNIKLLDNR
jgi:hypothetical protein